MKKNHTSRPIDHQNIASTHSIDTMQELMRQQQTKQLLTFITCGSVDDGKSTLIGRLLYEAHSLYEDQLQHLVSESSIYGTQGENMDFALLVDGLKAEREQGITIDVAYRFFSTDKRQFIVADTPGHEQYTRNMVTGASNAELAIILVDAQTGIVEQTRRHAFICALLGIKQVILAVNKMDLVGYKKNVFTHIAQDFTHFNQQLTQAFTSVIAIPVTATTGENMLQKSSHMSWYQGATLLASLETAPVNHNQSSADLRLPVQWVNRPDANFRGFAGTLAEGSVRPGDKVRVLPSGGEASIKQILLYKDTLAQAQTGQAVTVTLNKDIDVARGDVIVSADNPCEVADQFEADLVWMHTDTGFTGRRYGLQMTCQTINGQITEIKYKTDINSLQPNQAKQLSTNDIATVNISLDKPVPFTPYGQNRTLGSFILIDKFTQATVAAGMIKFALRRATNIHQQALSISQAKRQKLNGHLSKVLWFTGLSGSGKSTIANITEQKLHRQGIRTYLLDGDNLRHGLNKDLGFTEADRVENIRRVAEVARLMVDAGLVVLVAFISPFRAERALARSRFSEDEFIEIFVDTALEVAEQRDVKGLYKKARSGLIPNFTGINSPYEAPKDPEFSLNTQEYSAETLAQTLIDNINF